jgi:1,4-dihydroxy-2-naphthoate octaprenyltransferase
VVPVAVGTAAAAGVGDVVAWRALAALVVALAIQVGTNYVNDVADSERGADAARVGPTRLVASGLATSHEVKRAAVVAFAVGILAGLGLVVAVGPELIVVGVASVAAGWAYTDGPRPYGYAGWGEVFVFVFFGLVATIGSAYVHLDRVTGLSVLVSVPVGAAATALLVVNNLRDIPTDAAAGKNTLAVRWGPARTRQLYLRLMGLTVAGTIVAFIARPAVLLALLAVPLAISPVRSVAEGSSGSALIGVLGDTGRYQLAWGLLFAAGLWAGA